MSGHCRSGTLEMAMQCVMDGLQKLNFNFHQIPQSKQLASIMRHYPGLPVTVIPYEQTNHLLEDMAVSEKLDQWRDRTKYKKDPTTEAFCKLKVVNLTDAQLSLVCNAYQDDLKLFKSAKLPVPLCDDRVADVDSAAAGEKSRTLSADKKILPQNSERQTRTHHLRTSTTL